MKTKEKKQTMRQKKLKMGKLIVSNTFRVGMISIIAVFGLLNIIQITRISTTGYQMNDLEKEIVSLKRDTKQLEVHISTYRSINRIQERVEDMELVRADSIEYITIPGNIVARR